jgi:hypothetical protein
MPDVAMGHVVAAEDEWEKPVLGARRPEMII